jgi:hypothetical protein
MTVPVQDPINVSNNVNGVTSVFPYTFRILAAADLSVTVDEVVQQLGVHYTLDGVGNNSGGNVTFLPSHIPAAGTTVVRQRAMEYKRTDDFQTGGELRATEVNKNYDATVMMVQQLGEAIGRALLLPPGLAGVGTLPLPDALKGLRWNAAENGIENYEITGFSAPGGSDLIGFIQAGTDMVLQTLQQKARERLTAYDAGAMGNGVADDTDAVAAAIDQAISEGKQTVRLPAGRYRLTKKITKNLTGFKGFSLEGEGMGITEILIDYEDADGLELIADSGNYWLDVDQRCAIRIANLSLVTNRVDSGIGFKVNGGTMEGRPPAAISFDHVEFRGATSFFHAWEVCLDLVDVGSAQFNHCRVIAGGPGVATATGIRIRSSGAATDPTELKFTDLEVWYADVGVDAGDHVEGLYFSNPTFVNCNKGIKWVTTTGESGFILLGGHFNCFQRNVELENVFDITITGPVLYHGDSSVGFRSITLENCGAFTVSGAIMRGTVTDTGIYVGTVPVGWGGAIANNYFSGIGVASYLDTNSKNVVVSADNCYLNVADRVANFGTGNRIESTSYAVRQTVAIGGGSPQHTFTVAIPAGIFESAPRHASVMGTSFFTTFIYNFGGSSATLLSFTTRSIDGANFPPTSLDVSVYAVE